MPISVQVYPTMPSRPCRFCLCLQDGAVFADFDVDEQGHAFLQRISFDGYGCCSGKFKKMHIEDSHTLLDSVARDAFVNSKVDAILRAYFEQNADVIWSDALVSHGLL